MKFIKEHKDAFLLKLFSVNSLGVVLRTFLGLISQKLIAIYLGPSGIALIGNLRNALALFSLGATTGIDQGVLKYQSEFDTNTIKLQKLYSTSMAYGLLGSGLAFLILFFGADFWSNYLFKTKDYNYLFIILSFTLPFTAFYNFVFAVINGKSNYKKATLISFTVYTVITLLVIALVVIYGLSGALLAVILTPVSQILVLILFARKEIKLFFNLSIKFHDFFRTKLFSFIIMAIAAVVLSNLVELKLRNYLIEKLSIKDAGYWTSMLSLSNYYLSFLTGVYSLYVLPKYAKINSLKLFKIELLRIYRIVIPVFLLMFVGIYIFRDLVIQLLYTSEFSPMEKLFKWQLLGDLVKIIAVIMAYQFIAKSLWKHFIITEVISYVLFYIFGVYFVQHMGVEGIVFAHFIRYVLYLIIIVLMLPSTFNSKEKLNES